MTSDMGEFIKKYGTRSFILLVQVIVENPAISNEDIVAEVMDGLQLLSRALESEVGGGKLG